MANRAKLAAAGVAVILLPAACSGGDACAASADCPLSVTYRERPYLVSCDAAPRRLIGAELDVTYPEERDFGAAYGVDGFVLEGVDPGEALVVRFAHEQCPQSGPHMAYARDLSPARVEAVHRRVSRARDREL